jgi:hypothetical protein
MGQPSFCAREFAGEKKGGIHQRLEQRCRVASAGSNGTLWEWVAMAPFFVKSPAAPDAPRGPVLRARVGVWLGP